MKPEKLSSSQLNKDNLYKLSGYQLYINTNKTLHLNLGNN